MESIDYLSHALLFFDLERDVIWDIAKRLFLPGLSSGWFDRLVVPKATPHKANAGKLINFSFLW